MAFGWRLILSGHFGASDRSQVGLQKLAGCGAPGLSFLLLCSPHLGPQAPRNRSPSQCSFSSLACPSLTLPCGQRGWKVMARLGVHHGMGPHGAWVPQSTVRNAAPRRENDKCPLCDKPPPVSCPTGCSGWGNVAAWRGGGHSAPSLGTVRGGRAGLCEGEPMMLARVVQGRLEDGTGAGRRGSRPACGKAPFWRQRIG